MQQLMSCVSRIARWGVVLSAMGLAFPVYACSPENIRLTRPVTVSDAERAFVKSLPPLSVASIYAPPLVQHETNSGEARGISADIFCFIASQIGLEYSFLSGQQLSLAEHVKAVQHGTADVFMPLSYQASRAEHGLFSEGYYQSYYVAIADEQRGLTISSMDDLNAYRVGVVKNSALEGVLRSRLPDARIITLDDTHSQDIYQPLLDGKIDVLVHNRNFFKEGRYQHEVFTLEAVYTLHEHPRAYRFYFSRSQDHHRLIQLFDRYLAAIDTHDSVVAHEAGERHLIEKYVAQRKLRQFLEMAAGLAVLIVLLLAYWLYKYRRINAGLVTSNQQIAEQQSRLKETNKALDLLSKTDPLTGLYNKRYFTMMADRMQATPDQYLPLSVILLDADRFKKVNDHYGHLAGDDYLRTIGAIIRQHVSRKTDVAARYGGEEFACLLPNTPAADACTLAEAIRKAVAARRMPNGHGEDDIVTLSIGIATTSTDGGSELLARADEQLYAAKRSGRNTTRSIEC